MVMILGQLKKIYNYTINLVEEQVERANTSFVLTAQVHHVSITSHGVLYTVCTVRRIQKSMTGRSQNVTEHDNKRKAIVYAFFLLVHALGCKYN